MTEYAIEVRHLRKKFCRSLKRSLIYGTTDVFRAMSGYPNQDPSLRKSEFWALDDISFALRRGDSLGLIGSNGCGKSTLLRLLSGIFPPDQGEINIRGRMASLIAVGAGFHPHMSGAENIYLNGVLLGMNRAEIKKCYDEIVEFSEIGEFIEAPVSTYSSGMRVRLGFSIAVHTRPEILLVDEVMSVGDTRFRRKASDAMTNLLHNSKITLVLVSHNAYTVKQICDAALLMDHGREIYYGEVDEAYERYQQITNKTNGSQIEDKENSDYTFFHLSSAAGRHVVQSGEPFTVEFGLRDELIGTSELPLIITIFDADNSPVLNLQPPDQMVSPSGQFQFQASPAHLKDGKYTLLCKLGSSYQGTSMFRGYQFSVIGNPRFCHTAVCVDLKPVPQSIHR
jgi:ABC-type polysaccharide/polyol phosphate transport system ATPase subunit